MSHCMSLGGRRSLPSTRETESGKSLFLQRSLHGGHRIDNFTSVNQRYLHWTLYSELTKQTKNPFWEQVAPSDRESNKQDSGSSSAMGSGSSAGVICSLFYSPGCCPTSLAPACFPSPLPQLCLRFCDFPSIILINAISA